MARGNSKLAVQIDQRAYYGSVSLTAEPIEKPGLQVIFDPKFATEWQAAAMFGFEYAWEKVPQTRRSDSGLSILVEEIKGHEVDTSNVVIAFVAARALWDALGYEPPNGPTLLEAKGIFTFPK